MTRPRASLVTESRLHLASTCPRSTRSCQFASRSRSHSSSLGRVNGRIERQSVSNSGSLFALYRWCLSNSGLFHASIPLQSVSNSGSLFALYLWCLSTIAVCYMQVYRCNLRRIAVRSSRYTAESSRNRSRK